MASDLTHSRVSPASWVLLGLLTTVLVGSLPGDASGQEVSSVKAAFLYNFAKFAEWPALPPGDPIVFCIIGDEGIAAALVPMVRGQNISGHALDVRRSQDGGTWVACQLLFIADAETRRLAAPLGTVKAQPVLTVSDGNGFAQAAGIIELYVENGRMHFAINVEALDRSRLRLSSRLLGLAKIVKTRQGQ